MTDTRSHAVLVVVWTMASAFLAYLVVLIVCLFAGIEPSEKVEKVMGWLKEVSLFAGGGLLGLLGRTSSGEEPAKNVTITNPPESPVNVKAEP